MFANWLIMCGASTYFHIQKDHPYITSAKGLGGWGQKNGNFCLRRVWMGGCGGLEKGQKCADVI